MKKIILMILGLYSSLGIEAQSYHGVVCDSITHEPLEYAVISLYVANKPEASTTTTHNGCFILKSNKKKAILKASLLGYKTLSIENLSAKEILDTLFLAPKMLGAVEVVGSNKKVDIDKDSYFITDSMREGTTSAIDMIGLLPNITYNWVDKSISVYGQNNVLFLANGVELSEDYIKSINPKRIKTVEIIYNPSGRYISENYAALINLVLYEDYVGWDLNIEHESRYKLDQLNQWGWLQEENPSINYTYTHNSITVNALYLYDYKRTSVLEKSWKNYPGVVESGTESIDDDTPDASVSTHIDKLSTGIDYQISKNHSLSFQANYSYNSKDMRLQSTTWRKTSYQDVVNKMQNFQADNKYNDWIASIFYKGKIGNKLDLYSDFNYNYYTSNTHSSTIEEDWFSTKYKIYGRKNYIRFNTDATYKFTQNMTFKVGYSTTWKEYISQEKLNNLWKSQSDNYRNRLFSYLTYKLKNVWSISWGGAAEWVRYKNSSNEAKHFALIPDMRIMYKPSKKLDVLLQYYGTVENPTLAQTSITYRQDTLTTYIANPYLQQSVCHNISLRLRLWNCLTINPKFSFSNNQNTEFFQELDDNYVSHTNVNANFRSYSLGIYYQKMFLRNFILSADTKFERCEMEYNGIKNTCNNWTGSSYLMYINRKTGWRFYLQYSQRYHKSLLIQGFTRNGENLWMTAIMKTYYKGRLSFMLAYFPPIKWFVHETSGSYTYTNFYQYKSTTYNYDTIKNMLMLKISLRLDHGKKTKKQDNKATTDKE